MSSQPAWRPREPFADVQQSQSKTKKWNKRTIEGNGGVTRY